MRTPKQKAAPAGTGNRLGYAAEQSNNAIGIGLDRMNDALTAGKRKPVRQSRIIRTMIVGEPVRAAPGISHIGLRTDTTLRDLLVGRVGHRNVHTARAEAPTAGVFNESRAARTQILGTIGANMKAQGRS